MKSTHIRDVPEDTLKSLKQRAALHHRRLQQEIKFLLAMAARMPLPEKTPKLAITFAGWKPAAQNTWSRVDIYNDDGR